MTPIEAYAPILARLRCPDCLGDRLEPSEQAGWRCNTCRRVIQWRGRVLDALPSDMFECQQSNLDCFDSMSHEEENSLSARSGTRNHRYKLEAVHAALRLEGHGPKTVLEVGAGYGAHAAGIAAKGHSCIGLDISSGLLDQAVRRFPELEKALLVSGDATRIPFQAGIFDAAFCVATLHHLPQPDHGVKEMLRVLKPRGRFCFIEPRRFYPTQLVQYLRHPDTEVSAMSISPPNVKRWLQNAGVQQADTSYFVFTPNRPAVLTPLFDVVDRICAASALLKRLSVMLCVSGVKEMDHE